MIEVELNNIKKNYGLKNILDGFNLQLKTGEKVALIGQNGTGKSTILKLIAKQENIDSGSINIRNGAKIGILNQIYENEKEEILVKDFLYKSFEEVVRIEKKLKEFMQKYNLNELLARVLLNKGITEKENIDLFMNPTRNDFHNPFLMPDMEIAVDRILKAIDNNEKIIIYGDYDADGITSITVLKSFLEERGLEVDSYIPNRLDEGYGLNKEAIKKVFDDGHRLMITVDCGISGIAEVDYANSLGMEVLITDHHEPAQTLPNALAVVDAKRKDNEYPFNQLAGVGVVFKLIQAISIKLNLEEREYLKYLDIVCIGTISDIVPLVDENRVIAKLGLMLVNQTRNIGLKALLEVVGFKSIDSGTISFGVAPRINACGRMGHEQIALDLFLAKDYETAKKLAIKLNEYNTERQSIEKRIFDEAKEKIENEENNNACIIVGGEGWHHGIIGIVASKVTDMYFKPSILICFENNIGKGSGRSIPGFDLHEALMNCSAELEKFGGHAMAVGVTVAKDKFNEFKTKLEEYAKKCDIDKIVPIINIDSEVQLKNIDIDSVKSLKMLEPFGEANKTPLFLFKNLKINSIRALSEGKHLKLTLKEDNFMIDAIAFNMGELSEKYLLDDKVDVVGSLEINSFNGNDSIQIVMKDLRKSY